ncbi:hypothetical protein CRUP_030658 [Coryphaenoides rupestris]|nr:hypothetical protein CRUP_030658 [Coryphaenoides rupestris]
MIAMEYAPGGTLADYIQKRCNSLLDEDTILHFFVQILLALYHVHNKLILHRDLKTQNLLLDKHQMIVKVGDFGISKILVSKSKAYTGKPYNQKSDIWALGCVLYELASLKRAFEAANLPALVLKIMSGTFAPLSERYSPELRQLVLNMLNLDPSKRPQLNEIMALPVHTLPLSSVYTWGSGITAPLRLPMLNTEVLQVSLGRTQRMGVTKSGRLITWEPPSVGCGEPSLPGGVDTMQPQFVSRFLEGQSGVTIKSVACGDLFTTCMTDRDRHDPKIVEALLGYELVQVSCGASHVLAVTNEREVFAWGRGDNGRLGLGSLDSHSSPQQVAVPGGFETHKVLCAVDCSMETQPVDQVEEVHVFTAVRSAPLSTEKMVYVDIGTAHSIAVTEKGECFTFGSNQHGQIGCSSRRTSRVPYLVPGLQGIAMAACGDAFSLAVGSGE